MASVAATVCLVAAVAAPGAEASPATVTVAVPSSVHAALVAAENDANVAVAVLDTQTGLYYGSSQAEAEFPSESVVKILIAIELLATGQMTGDTEQTAYQMITASDDDDADALWGQVGGPDVFDWVQSRYGIADLGAPPTQPGWWGNTKFTAHGLVELYAAVEADPVVGPWLLDAMSHMAPTADDGTDQDFGLAAQTTAGAFKQGWGGDDDNDDSEQLNSTGLLDGDRFAVALLVQHVPYEPMSSLLPAIDAVAAAVAPSGAVVAPVAPVAAAPSSTASSPVSSPSAASSRSAVSSPSATSSPIAASSPVPKPVTKDPPVKAGTRLLAGRVFAARELLGGRILPLAAGILVIGFASLRLVRRRRRKRS